MSRRNKTRRPLPIPDETDWAGYANDLDVQDLHRLCFGKSAAEVQRFFDNGQAINRADELLFAPRRVFQYYVGAFADYLLSDAAMGDSDAASPFLSLLEAREERDPGSVACIYPGLEDTLGFIASHQDYYAADPAIYGSFADRAQRIRVCCTK